VFQETHQPVMADRVEERPDIGASTQPTFRL
jgi:hypothetical protein